MSTDKTDCPNCQHYIDIIRNRNKVDTVLDHKAIGMAQRIAELLEALKAVITVIGWDSVTEPVMWVDAENAEAYHKAKAAITKAEGKS